MSKLWFAKRLLEVWFPTEQNATTADPRDDLHKPTWLGKSLLRKRETQLKLNRRQTPPVVVIGNIVVGGAGKTPLIVELVEKLKSPPFSISVAVICGGYGGSIKTPRQVTPNSEPVLHGDESVMLAKLTQVPIFAGRDRQATYDLAVSTVNPQLVLSDDGLQHFGLERALQIACFDSRGIGNGRILPMGPLREPLSSLAGFDALVLPNTNELAFARQYQYVPQFKSATLVRGIRELHATDRLTLNEWYQKQRSKVKFSASEPVHLLAGIANPQRFFELMAKELPTLQFEHHALSDHAPLDTSLALKLKNRCVIMTEKDAVKWKNVAPTNSQDWHVLQISRETDDGLIKLILDRLQLPPTYNASKQSR